MVIRTEARKLVNTKPNFNYPEIDKYLNKKGYDRLDINKGAKPPRKIWVKLVDKHPEWFGTSKAHIEKVKKDRIRTDKIVERNLNPDKYQDEEITEFDIGVYVRAKSRLCKITNIEGESITVLFPNNKSHTYDKNDIKIYKNQKKAIKKYQEELERRGFSGVIDDDRTE